MDINYIHVLFLVFTENESTSSNVSVMAPTAIVCVNDTNDSVFAATSEHEGCYEADIDDSKSGND